MCTFSCTFAPQFGHWDLGKESLCETNLKELIQPQTNLKELIQRSGLLATPLLQLWANHGAPSAVTW